MACGVETQRACLTNPTENRVGVASRHDVRVLVRGALSRCKSLRGDEMADVFCHLLNLSIAMDIDLSDALRVKMVKNAVKFPADKYRGKYTV